jgi:hypothetical protein
MTDKEMEEILDQLYKDRVDHRSHNIPKSHSNKWVGGSHGINFDFASLYPSTMSMNLGGKSIRKVKRKMKINNIFN